MPEGGCYDVLLSLEEAKDGHENHSWDIQEPGRDTNSLPPEYLSTVLL
jgi:hypothetical protein